VSGLDQMMLKQDLFHPWLVLAFQLLGKKKTKEFYRVLSL